MPETLDYLIIGAVAAVVTFAVTPVVARFATRVGWIVLPDERRVHTRPTPHVGGIAMFVGFAAALLALFWTRSSRNLEDRDFPGQVQVNPGSAPPQPQVRTHLPGSRNLRVCPRRSTT